MIWRLLFIFIVVLLQSCGTTQKEVKTEETSQSRYETTEIDENVQGEDSASRENIYTLRLYDDYKYNQDSLLRRLKKVSGSKRPGEKVEALSIRAMLGQKKEALIGLETMLDYYPGHRLILQNLANVHMELGNYEMAKLILLKLISKNKGDSALHNNIGLLFYRTGNIPEAIQAWRRAVKLSPSHVDARLNLAALALDNGNFPESLELCNQVLERESRNTDAFLCKCISLMGQGDFPAADSCYSDAERKFSSWTDLEWNRAFSLYRIGKYNESLKRIDSTILKKRKALNPDSPIFDFIQQVKMEMKAKQATMAPPPAAPAEPAPQQTPPSQPEPKK